MSNTDVNQELQTTEVLSEIDTKLAVVPETSQVPSFESIKKLTEKREPALQNLNHPASARAIFSDLLLESADAFDARILAIDIGDTYRREATPESFAAAQQVFDKVRAAKITSGALFDTITGIHITVAEALLSFSRNSEYHPNHEGLTMLKDAAQLATAVLDLKEDKENAEYVNGLLNLGFIKNLLARAIQLCGNYALRMGDITTHMNTMFIEETHGLAPSTPNEKGNRLGTIAQTYFENATKTVDISEISRLLTECIQIARMAQENHKLAQSPAGFASAVLGEVLEMRAELLKIHKGVGISIVPMTRLLATIESDIMNAGAEIQHDALASNARPLVQELKNLGYTETAERLRGILGLQS